MTEQNIKYPEAAANAAAAIAPIRAWVALGGYGQRGIIANQALDDFVFALSGDLDRCTCGGATALGPTEAIVHRYLGQRCYIYTPTGDPS